MASSEGQIDGQKYAQGAVSLYIVCDTTGSMSQYIHSLRTTLPQVLAVSRVFFGDSTRIHIISYKDYCDKEVISTCSGTPEELQQFASKLIPDGGGDWPEAAKTALNRVIQMVDTEAQDLALSSPDTPPPQPIVLLYTDAPPHHKLFDALDNYTKESKFLADSKPGFDWIQICRTFRERSIPVYTFISSDDEGLRVIEQGNYIYGLLGSIIVLDQTDSQLITRATMAVQLSLFGERLEDTSKLRHFSLSPPTISSVFGPNPTSLPDEDTGLDSRFAAKNPLGQSGFDFPAVPGLADLLKALPSRFVKDPAFQDVVFEVLKQMFTPENVLAITYNGIVGSLWRLCCRRKDDERLPKLRDELGKCVQLLPKDSREVLQAWLEKSYDQTEEIEEEIRKAEVLSASRKGDVGVLVMEGAGEWAPSREELMSIARAPMPSVLAGAQRVLTQVMVVEKADGVRYLPMGLSDERLFAMLPHLVCGGTLFTKRPAAVMALLAWLSGNACLKGRAERFLKAIKGQWIALDKVELFPEVLSDAFVKLLSLGVDEFLTEKEVEVYKRANVIRRLRMAAPKEFGVRVPFHPRKAEVWPDDKQECSKCHHLRSFTLLQDNVCGICLSAEPNDPPPTPDSSPTQSHLVQCKMCTSLYAVSHPEDLKCEPKCHYCRVLHTPPPTVTCTLCLNKFVHPTSPLPTTFTCAPCRGPNPEASISTLNLPLSKLINTNKQLISIFGLTLPAADSIFSPHIGSLFKIYTQQGALFFDTPSPPEFGSDSAQLEWGGKVVHEASRLVEEIRVEVLTGSLSGTCYLCFEERALVALESACGRCANKACATCLGAWYGQARPGELVLRTHLTCAFCKRAPVAATLKRHNKLACALVRKAGGDAHAHARADMYYAWCVKCYLVKELIARECASDELPVVRNFACEDCQREEPKGVKPCPGCAAPTAKGGGCNHITCVCGVHWCYECGDGFEAGEIYEHMYHLHGGIGLDEE